MAKNEAISQVNEVNRISAGTEFKGELTSSGDVRIDGTFEGTLDIAGKLVMGDNAKCVGDIVCKNCDVWGIIEGTMTIRGVLWLRKSASIKGEVVCQRLIVEEGGVLNGSCTMSNGSNGSNGGGD